MCLMKKCKMIAKTQLRHCIYKLPRRIRVPTRGIRGFTYLYSWDTNPQQSTFGTVSKKEAEAYELSNVSNMESSGD